jgi:hypothetical protein
MDVLPFVQTNHLLVIAYVDNSLLELPSRHFAVEEDVKLAVGTVLELWQEEVRRDPADDRGAAPDVAALAGHVPAGSVEHLRGEVDYGDFGDVLFECVSDGPLVLDERKDLRKLHGRHRCSEHGDGRIMLLR